jgi:hypothetical protein
MVLSECLKSWITATVGWIRRFENGSMSKDLPLYDCGLHFRILSCNNLRFTYTHELVYSPPHRGYFFLRLSHAIYTVHLMDLFLPSSSKTFFQAPSGFLVGVPQDSVDFSKIISRINVCSSLISMRHVNIQLHVCIALVL